MALHGLCIVPVCQVCYNKKCEDVKNVKSYGTNDCSSKCNNHGVRSCVKVFKISSRQDAAETTQLTVRSFGRCATMKVRATAILAGLLRFVT